MAEILSPWVWGNPPSKIRSVRRRTNSEIELLKISERGWVRPLSAADLPDLSIQEEESYDLDLPLEEVDLDEIDESIEEGERLLKE